MARLDGTTRTVQVAAGYSITAPGITGDATAYSGVPGGTRAPGVENATDAFVDAMRETDMAERQLIQIRVDGVNPTMPHEEVRTAAGEEGLVLETPDFGANVGQVVLAVDEDGAMSWYFPVDTAGSLQPPDVRGSGGTKRFIIRRVTPQTPAGAPNRGLVGMVGSKLLKLLIYPLTDLALGAVGEKFAAAWEGKYRPYGTRFFEPAGYRTPGLAQLQDADWDQLAQGPNLWFVHGTFSTSHGGFYQLPPEFLGALNEKYQNRVVAFDHPSLSVDPLANAAELSSRIPDGMELEVDIVAHSRGGLVARAIAGELDGPLPGLRVRRAVLVGTPNHGTPLANPDHMIDFLDRITTWLNVIPPGPASVVTEVLEAVLTAVKVLGHAALKGLPGLTSMDPSGEYLKRLNAGAAADTVYYAVGSDYDPVSGLRTLAKSARNLVMDRVFADSANDLVVPTAGVYEGSADPAFPIPEDRRLVFAKGDGIDHGGYFARPQFAERLSEWLPG
ncbi:MAG TPA: hypothetical protein VHM94_16695 [Acidimicrobiia bacterium]|nr:hypothetical protein [Acidimicrobiia bacterium]